MQRDLGDIKNMLEEKKHLYIYIITLDVILFHYTSFYFT